MSARRVVAFAAVLSLLLLGLAGLGPPASSAPVVGADMAYTTSADFAKGTIVNLNSDEKANQLQLNKTTSTFPFIWVALSDRETIAKIDTRTGVILGEYRAMSEDAGVWATSRTTVMSDGSVWVGHRFISSIAHVGLSELNQCVDRNGNGTIETSTGYGDVLGWPGGSSGISAPVSAALDECILAVVDTPGGDSRHMSIDTGGALWVGDFAGGHGFVKLNAQTGEFLLGSSTEYYRQFSAGGYGGFVDGNNVLWSSNGGSTGLLRWNLNDPAAADAFTIISIPVYGLAIDPGGNVWVNEYGSTVRKVSPAGDVLGTFPNGSPSGGSQGLAVDRNGDVWISSAFTCSSTTTCGVSHLKNDGTFVGVVPNPEGYGSSGVAVDADGKVWTANYASSTATRIDPNAGEFSTTTGLETTRVGAVDAVVPLPATSGAGKPTLPAAAPYNYSDMTGGVALGTTAPQGIWSVVQDSGQTNFDWHTISFNNEKEGFIPPGAAITLNVEARAADTEAGLGSKDFQTVGNCVQISGLRGRFVQVRIVLKPNAAGDSPVLSDVWIRGGPGVPPGECVKPTTPEKPKKANGYLVFAGNGAVYAHGDVSFLGVAGGEMRAAAVTSPVGHTLNAPVVGGAVTPDGKGYYLVGGDGGVFTFGNAVYKGSTGAMKLNQPIVGMAADPDGSGYWLVARDGGVFSFDAAFAGSTGALKLNKPVVGMTADPDGTGYWLAAEDGGVFSFDAAFAGSTGALKLNKPVVGIAADPDGTGYWLAASDGGVFSFGAAYAGSLGGTKLAAPVVGITADPDGSGYWMTGEDGGVFAFDAAFYGTPIASIATARVVGIAAP